MIKKSFLLSFLIFFPFFLSSCFSKEIPFFVEENFSEKSDKSEKIEESSVSNQKESFSFKTTGDFDFYIFEKDISQKIKDFSQKNQGASLVLTLKPLKCKKNYEDEKDLFSFLTEEDFSNGKLIKTHHDKAAVSFNFNDFLQETDQFSISLGFPKNSSIPKGFFIKTKDKYKILSVKITKLSCGFDFSKNEFYSFCANGGILNKSSKKVDLSGIPFSFASQNTKTSLLPVIEISLKDSKIPVRLLISSEKITVRSSNENSTDSKKVKIPLASLKNPFSSIEITENQENVESILVEQNDEELLLDSSTEKNSPLIPYKIDPGLIMSWPKSSWRGIDYELFEWDRFSNILFFDTANYAVQDDFFRRLAYFVEKKGFKGRLLSDEELAGKHGYNAHDYRSEDLARFFQKADEENFPLNKKELLLKEILLKNGVIVENQGKIEGGSGAVISISQESSMYLRRTFVAHEGWHGIYFVDEDFRNTVSAVFYSLLAQDKTSLDFLIRYFEVTPSLNYDTSDEYLLKNEFMAYMLQRSVPQVEQYYVDMASRNHAQSKIKTEADYIIQTKAQSFVGASTMLEDYVLQRWNLQAGRVWLLSR